VVARVTVAGASFSGGDAGRFEPVSTEHVEPSEIRAYSIINLDRSEKPCSFSFLSNTVERMTNIQRYA
jgi:hypothetical protein